MYLTFVLKNVFNSSFITCMISYKNYRFIDTSNVKTKYRRKLTRIHVHTLAYQAILTVGTSDWKYSHVAAAKASLTAYRHVCASDQV